MAYQGPEAMVDAINAYLLAEMPAKIAALNTLYSDNITLVVPVEYYVGERSLMEVPEYPAVYTLVPDMPISRLTPDLVDATYDTVIGILVMEQDTEVLRRKLYRYTKAIIEILAASLTDNLGWFVAQTSNTKMRASFSPIYSADEVFMSDAQVFTTCRRRQLETL